ncbi:MAG: TIGR02996 domain-containing protein [Gemmataceae bacterium]|nr:TIGR02996 domain-containing protein [Gemmataceae bacterium]
MSDEAGLLLAIREHPSDDLPRIAWADWLDENGRSERAELVRLQLALARRDERDIPPGAAFRRGVPSVFFLANERLLASLNQVAPPCRVQFI